MSAWLVSRNHIDALVAARRLVAMVDPSFDDGATDTHLGRALWHANMESLASRYGEAVDESTLDMYVAAESSPMLGATVLYKLVKCYVYQCDEYSGWEESHAARYCEAFEHACRALGAKTSGPEYNAAPWGIE